MYLQFINLLSIGDFLVILYNFIISLFQLICHTLNIFELIIAFLFDFTMILAILFTFEFLFEFIVDF